MSENSIALQKPINIYSDDAEGTTYNNETVQENTDVPENANSNNATDSVTPTIPKSVYSSLPSLLKKGAEVFDNDRERDVFYRGLSVLSGCFSNISGCYDGYEIYPNLNTMVIAPPASGKSRMKFAEKLVRPLQDNKMKKYEHELSQFKTKKKGTAKVSSPNFQSIFIAGNTSATAVISS